MYSVEITGRAEKELRRLGNEAKKRMVPALLGLGANPRPSGCLKVQSAEGACRIRVGDYRIAYMVDDGARVVRVIHVGLRDHFYA